MGCCVSVNNEGEAKASSTSKKDQQRVKGGSDEASKSKGFSHENRAPPPSAEEETVKEVLSETPKPKPKPDPAFTANEMKQDLEEEQGQETKTAHQSPEALVKLQEISHQDYDKKQNQNLSSNNEEVMSEVSEICSMSMSMSESMSTMTNVTDKRDNEEEQEVKQLRVSSRSPAKPLSGNGFKRERVVNQSPTRRSDQSPRRRIGSNGSARLVQSSRDDQVRAMGRRGLASDPVRRDPGESSGRRSRSPATARSSAAMGRSPSAKRVNRSPGRVRTDPVESSNSNRKANGRNLGGKWARANSNDNNNNNNNSSNSISNNNNSTSTNESLENPLVSLECFIFL